MGGKDEAEPTTVGRGVEIEPAAQGRVDELVERLTEYRASYYAGEPAISDEAYDALEDELRSLAPAHPLLAKVGSSELVEAWEKAPHEIPMGSLNKVVSEQELRDWLSRCNELLAKEGHGPIDEELLVAEKLDGISVELLYREGAFADGITRGDGAVGERITANVARMRGVPPTIADRRPLSVRGEIILRLSDMQEHFPGVTSPRNAAAGTARRLDGEGNEHLTVLVYDVAGAVGLQTEREKFELLRSLGFATPQSYLGTVDEALDLHRRYADGLRQQLDYEIDGLVVRANGLDAQDRLGELNHRPRGAVAFKFASPQKVSTVVAIRWDTGPSGRVTPVAIVEPVQLAGATVQRASLHNASRVRALGIGVGDEALISRRNDVIPYVEEVVVKHGPDAAVPERCGRCEQPLQAEGEYLLCRNERCPALVEGRIRNWIDAVGAMEWGDRLVEQVVEAGLVQEPLDLYGLTVAQLADLERQGEKSAQNALDQLHQRRPLSLPVFLAALGIEGFGLQTARLLVASGYGDLAGIRNATEAELAAIKGLGSVKAAAILRGLERRADEIERLVAGGLAPVAETAAGALAGKSFCITGKHGRSRKELTTLIEAQGGQVVGSVSKNLDYLVIADPASTSSKANKARQVGTELLSEEQLLALCGAG